MNPHAHFIGGVLSGALGYKFGLIHSYDILIIGIIAVLIDLDHYLLYIRSVHDYDPKRFWNTATQLNNVKHLRMRSFIHHYNGMAIIFPILMIVLLLDTRIGYIGLSAYLSHMLLDHLRYFHIEIAPYKATDLFGFNIIWNRTEEMFFVVMAVLSVMVML